MDVTRDSSQRPDSWPPAVPELAPAGATQLSRAVANAVARPLIKASPALVEDELESTPSAQPPAAQATPAARRPPRADPGLREQHARALPGWIALSLLVLVVAGAVLVLARTGVIPHFEALPDIRSVAAREAGEVGAGEMTTPVIAAGCAAGLLALLVLGGLLVNAGGETRVLTRWGRYRGTVRRNGLVWVNPALRRRRVDVRLRHWRSEPVHVVDRTGTPIVVQLLIVWRVKDTARALFGLAAYEDYLREQVQAVLTRTASTLPCDSNAVPGPALRDGQWFADELTRALAAEVAPAGLEVYSVQPLALDYAPEVAESMRRRRLADLDAGLRTVLVDDAVEAAALAVRRLERATALELDQAARRSLMEQLLVAFVAPAGVTASASAPVPSPATRAGRKEGRPA
ncbi:SPFH domain-containing protein [Kitasatospora sp. MAP5-34]|uniref:SPFH domain-containing protein n=1 Tax=Kitasatospora sp. MAP5-34 TaxID=3035102 RepID=UPI00247635A3|nr:SPFH domain-containing protein [Kitasatospora sp. MAP5-34]MDH6576283.1 regulator of protease activity HflC (stomatin/prohibitin superfamily) [Kitasatospora sp. MAP5-34]